MEDATTTKNGPKAKNEILENGFYLGCLLYPMCTRQNSLMTHMRIILLVSLKASGL